MSDDTRNPAHITELRAAVGALDLSKVTRTPSPEPAGGNTAPIESAAEVEARINEEKLADMLKEQKREFIRHMGGLLHAAFYGPITPPRKFDHTDPSHQPFVRQAEVVYAGLMPVGRSARPDIRERLRQPGMRP